MKIFIFILGIYALIMFSTSYIAMVKHLTDKKKILKGSVIFVPSLIYVLFTCIISWLEITK